MNALDLVESRYWPVAGWTMLHFLWIGAIVAACGLLLKMVLARASAPVRYVTALVCLAAMAVAPVAIFVVLLRGEDRAAENMAAAMPAAVAQKAAPAKMVARVPAVMAKQPQAAPVAAASSSPATSQSQLITYAQRAAKLLDWASQRLPWLWLVGSPAMLLLLLTGVVGAERLRRTAAAASDELCERAAQLAKSLGIRRAVLVSTSASATTPLLLGIVRPMILLPASTLTGLSTSQLEMILLHELAHVRRHDNLINLLQRVVEALLFFHPGVWKLSAWVRLERELCCDRLVIRHTREPLAYAETLALLAVPQMSPRHALAAMASHQLVTRIRHMLNLEDHPMKVSRKVLVAALAVVVTFGLWIGAHAQTKDEHEKSKDEAAKAPAADAQSEKQKADDQFIFQVYRVAEGNVAAAARALRSALEARGEKDIRVEVDDRTSSLLVRYPHRLQDTIHSLVRAVAEKTRSTEGAAGKDSEAASQAINLLVSRFDSRGQLASKADKLSFIRRLSEALRGVPPTKGEIEKFLNDDSPQAAAKLVKRMAEEVLKREPSSDDVRSLLSHSARITDEATKKLFEAELHIQELLQTYGGSHPKVVAARQQIEALKQQLQAQEAHKRSTEAATANDAAYLEFHRFKDLKKLGEATCKQCHDQSAAHALNRWRWTFATSPDQAKIHAEQYFCLRELGMKPPYSAEQATGAPDTPNVGDHPTAWSSREEDNTEQWLELTYQKPIEAVAVVVYETFNPGAVAKITLLDSIGNEMRAWTVEDKVTQKDRPHVAVFPLQGSLYAPVASVRLAIKSQEVTGFNQIDAVGLLDAAGQVHWATDAKASSTYAEAQPQDVTQTREELSIGAALNSFDGVFGGPPNQQARDPEPRVKRLEDEVLQLRQSIDELKELLKKQPAATSEPSDEVHWRGAGQKFRLEMTPSHVGLTMRPKPDSNAPADVVAQLLKAVAAGNTDEAAQLFHAPSLDNSHESMLDIVALMKEAPHFDVLTVDQLSSHTARVTTRSWRSDSQGKEISANVTWELRLTKDGWRVTSVSEAKDSSAAGATGEATDGVRISIPAPGPSPAALDFSFPVHSSQDLESSLYFGISR